MSQPDYDQPAQISFRQLHLSESLLQSVEGSGYVFPTPIQAQTIPLLLAGRDVVGQAQTGTGKTAAFALPMLQRIELCQNPPQVLVLTPTRELAIQVAEAFGRYGAATPGLRVVPIYGGQSYEIQLRQLKRGVHVVVGTPGRVMDHMRRGTLKLDGLRGLVLDEADEMLRMGFVEDVQWILTQTPAERQIALFSATLPQPIRQIAQQHLRQPAEVTIRQRAATADTVRQRFVVAAPHQKKMALGRILEAEPTDGVIVFVKTKSSTEPLAEHLAQAGHKTAALNGDIPQKQRERIIDQLRAGRVDVIVATDVAARGLDVKRISHVVNFDLPMDSESYVHRIGRTGRAGRSGEAILFVHPRERRLLNNIERSTGQSIEPMELPSNRTINKQRVARFHQRITQGLAHDELEKFASVVEQYRKENDIPLEQIAAALAVLANGESSLLANDDLKPTSFAADSRQGGDAHRSSRGARPSDPGKRCRSEPKRGEAGMETFRIEVGRAHQVKPGNIVGAIANEADLDSGDIGRIKIFDEFSTVDLPRGMPSKVFHMLKTVWVSGRQLNISRINAASRSAKPFQKRFKAKRRTTADRRVK